MLNINYVLELISDFSRTYYPFEFTPEDFDDEIEQVKNDLLRGDIVPLILSLEDELSDAIEDCDSEKENDCREILHNLRMLEVQG